MHSVIPSSHLLAASTGAAVALAAELAGNGDDASAAAAKRQRAASASGRIEERSRIEWTTTRRALRERERGQGRERLGVSSLGPRGRDERKRFLGLFFFSFGVVEVLKRVGRFFFFFEGRRRRNSFFFASFSLSSFLPFALARSHLLLYFSLSFSLPSEHAQTRLEAMSRLGGAWTLAR